MPVGAPKGNRNGAKSKDWEAALRRTIKTFEDKTGDNKIERGEALNKIAEVCVKQALAGDKDARTEIANRLDGKPTEHVHVEHTDGPLSYAERLAQERAAHSQRAPATPVGDSTLQ